jgi:hypothetical protein
MNKEQQYVLSKVPEITLIFWIIKILATTLGETGGDALSMSMNLGYAVSTGIFAAVFVVAVTIQVLAKKFHPAIYWTTIVATTTVGTTLADFVDRSLGIGYLGGTTILLQLLLASLWIWKRALGSVAVDTVTSPKSEIFYWLTIMCSQVGHGTGRLDGGHGGSGLRRRGAGFRWDSRCHCCLVLSDKNIAYNTVLVGIHPDPSLGRGGGRFPGQAQKSWRLGNEPLFRFGHTPITDGLFHFCLLPPTGKAIASANR